MAYTYREWVEGDDLRLLEVLPAPESDPVVSLRALIGPDHDEPFWSRTVIAEDSVAVGAGALQRNPLHPSRLWAFVEVGTSDRGEGVGQHLAAMLRSIAAEHHPGLPLRTKVAPGSTGEKFAQSQGMVPVMTHRHVVVAPGALATQSLGYEDSATEAIEDLATGSIELTRAVGRFYQAVNGWDPPAEMTLGQVNKQFLAESAQAYGAVVLRRGVDRGAGVRGEIAAFAISYRSLDRDVERAEADPQRLAELDELPTDVLIGWDPALGDEQAIAAISKLVSLLAARYPIRVEVTDAMAPLAMVCARLVAEGGAKIVAEAVTYADSA